MSSNRINELRKLTSDLEQKKKVEAIKQQNRLNKERKNLVNGAVNKKQQMASNINREKKKSLWQFYWSNPRLITLLILLSAGCLFILILSGNKNKPQITNSNVVLKKEVDFGSRDYNKISNYVKEIIDLAANNRFDETTESAWHRNAAPEARYYSTLRLQELDNSTIPAIQKIFHYPEANCFSCICSQKQQKNDLIVKIALQNKDLKLVAIE